MSRRAIRRVLLASVITSASLVFTGAAAAGGCSATLNPPAGYPGATVQVAGSGFPQGPYYFNFTSNEGSQPAIDPIEGTVSQGGTIGFVFQIPTGFQMGTANWLLHTGGNCEVSGSSYVIGPEPTTTTSTTSTSTSTTSTSTSTTSTSTSTTSTSTTSTPTTSTPTTSTSAATTSTTTTSVPETTTSEVEDTTTTTEDITLAAGETMTPGWVWWLILVLLLAVAVLGWSLFRRRTVAGAVTDEPPPPPPAE